MLVVQIAQEADGTVDGDHEQDADDVFLLEGLEVAGGVLEDEEEGDEDADEAEDCGDDEAEVVEGEAVFPEGVLIDLELGERVVALLQHGGRVVCAGASAAVVVSVVILVESW